MKKIDLVEMRSVEAGEKAANLIETDYNNGIRTINLFDGLVRMSFWGPYLVSFDLGKDTTEPIKGIHYNLYELKVVNFFENLFKLYGINGTD